MLSGRTWVSRASPVIAAGILLSCTSSPPAPSVPSSAATTARRLDADEVARQLDLFFEQDAATLNAFRNRRAFLITQDGKTLVERYWQSSATTTAPVYSITKTVMSLLIGAALDEGKLRGVDQTLRDLLPSYRGVMSPQVGAITLRQLLTMTSGLPSDGSAPLASGASTDWIRDVLVHGVTLPRGFFAFSSAGSRLLSAILTQATGGSTLDYAREKLFDPLGIPTRPADAMVALPKNLGAYERAGFAWPTDPQHRNTGDDGVKLTARDLAKLGQLWLQDGRWGNRQLMSNAWMRAARTDRVSTNVHVAVEYGYQVWIADSSGHEALLALGDGGQMVEIVPDLGLVVVTLSRFDPRRPDAGTADTEDYAALVAGIIVPAVR